MTIRSKVPNKAFRDSYDSIVWNHEKDAPTEKGNGGPVGPLVIHDIQPFVAPDGTVINSRQARTKYMKANGLAFHEDFKEHMPKAQRDRELRMQGLHPDQKKERIQNMRDAWEHNRDKSRYSRG